MMIFQWEEVLKIEDLIKNNLIRIKMSNQWVLKIKDRLKVDMMIYLLGEVKKNEGLHMK